MQQQSFTFERTTTVTTEAGTWRESVRHEWTPRKATDPRPSFTPPVIIETTGEEAPESRHLRIVRAA